jgi:hypothetical protein
LTCGPSAVFRPGCIQDRPGFRGRRS